MALDQVPETGRHYDLNADEQVCAAVAELARVRTLTRLQAILDVTRHGHDGLRVVGNVSAAVGQDCVVTLDPIDSEVDEAIDVLFYLTSGRRPVPRTSRETDSVTWKSRPKTDPSP